MVATYRQVCFSRAYCDRSRGNESSKTFMTSFGYLLQVWGQAANSVDSMTTSTSTACRSVYHRVFWPWSIPLSTATPMRTTRDV